LLAGTASSSDALDADSKRVQAWLDYEASLVQLSEYFVAIRKSPRLGWVDPG
jgi:hypothetical protein